MKRLIKKTYVLGMITLFSICFYSPSFVLAEDLIIAVIPPITGAGATWGSQSLNMAKLIEEEINAAGGFKVKGGKVNVVFKYYNDESSPEVGSTVATRAISDGARIIICGPWGPTAFVVSELTERARVLDIDPWSTADKLTERGFKYFFRINNYKSAAVRESIKYLLWQEQKTGVKIKSVVIFTTDNITGRVTGDAYQEWISKLAPHWKVQEYVRYSPKTTEFTKWLTSFKAKKIDILLGDQYVSEAMLVTRQCREVNYNPIAIHGVHGGHYDPEYGQNLQWQALGTTDTCYFSPFAKIPGLKVLNEKYKKKYGTDIPQNSGNIACGLTLIKDAVERAGSIEIEAMRKAVIASDITRIEYKEGEWWWIKAYGCKFDEKGQNVKASNVTNLWTSPTSFEQVYPENFATATAPWPRLTWEELEKQYASKYPVGKK